MTSTPETRYSLIAKLHDRADVEAWEEFAQLYQPLIFRIVSSRGLQFADANDVTQEVMTRVSKAIETWDPAHQKSTFRGWLYRITRNLTIDFLRRQEHGTAKMVDINRHKQLELIADPSSQESAEFYLHFEKQLFALIAHKVQSQVRANTWQAFWRSEVLNEPINEIAVQLDMSAGAVYVARSRVMARIKQEAQIRLTETNGAV